MHKGYYTNVEIFWTSSGEADLKVLRSGRSAGRSTTNDSVVSFVFSGVTLFKLPQFWDTLWHNKGTLVGFVSACHPQMDGHALVLDRSIDSQLVE